MTDAAEAQDPTQPLRTRAAAPPIPGTVKPLRLSPPKAVAYLQ